MKIKGLRGNKWVLPACYAVIAGICGIFLDTTPHRPSTQRMNLPPSAMEFARIIGLGATLRLADCARPDHRERRRAGYRIKVPMGPLADDHALVRTVGRENAELIHRHFAGEMLPFPARRIRAITRDILIARDFTQGIPVPVLAEHHGVSERTVTRALDRVTGGDIARAGQPHPPGLGPPGGGPMRV